MKIVFHSSAGGKMEPVKQNAEVLLEKATSLKSSSFPENDDVEKVKSLLNRLYAESAAINTIVKTQKPDTDLKAAVEKAHNTFHELMAVAKKEHDEHE